MLRIRPLLAVALVAMPAALVLTAPSADAGNRGHTSYSNSYGQRHGEYRRSWRNSRWFGSRRHHSRRW